MHSGQSRPQVLIVSGGHYFKEVYAPLIEDCDDVDFHVILQQGAVNGAVSGQVHALRDAGLVKSVHVVPEIPLLALGLGEHRAIARVYRHLQTLGLRLLVTEYDIHPNDRYAIECARRCGGKVVSLSSGATASHIMRQYWDKVGETQARVAPTARPRLTLGRIAASLCHRLGHARRRLARHVFHLFHYQILPRLFYGAGFDWVAADKLRCITGRVDAVIAYDIAQLNAQRLFNPALTRMILCRHPLDSEKQAVKFTPREGAAGRVLVSLSGNFFDEMAPFRTQRWVQILQACARHTGVMSYDLRLHPRTAAHLAWPKRLIAALEAHGLKIGVSDAHAVPFFDTIPHYAGFIAAPSTILVSVRAARQDCFVLGVEHGHDDSYLDERWVYGMTEGIAWIAGSEDPGPHHFRPPPPRTVSLPRAADVLRAVIHGQVDAMMLDLDEAKRQA